MTEVEGVDGGQPTSHTPVPAPKGETQTGPRATSATGNPPLPDPTKGEGVAPAPRSSGFEGRVGPHAHSVSAGRNTSSLAVRKSYGMDQRTQSAPGTRAESLSTPMVGQCVGTTNTQWVASAKITGMNLQAVETLSMAQPTVPLLSQLVSRQRSRAQTPYHPQAWKQHIMVHSLSNRHAHISDALFSGFTVNAPHILSTYTPPNHPSIGLNHCAFRNIIKAEFSKGRYLGPFS